MRAISVESGGEYVNGADVLSTDVFTSQPLLSQGLAAHALEHGINFIDAADTYSSGTLEEMVGQWPKKLGVRREDLLIATKVYGPMGASPNDAGNSRLEATHA